MERILTECGAGKGAVVLLDGPGGSGKTELLHRAAETAQRRGALVLRASCSRAERALPFGVLGQLLNTVPAGREPGTRLQRLYRRLTAAVTAQDPAPTPTGIGPELALLLNDVAGALLELAEPQPEFGTEAMAREGRDTGPEADAPPSPGAEARAAAVTAAQAASGSAAAVATDPRADLGSAAAVATDPRADLGHGAVAPVSTAHEEPHLPHPLLFIGIDNLRHADPRSLDCLLYLARRTASARIVLVLTDDAVAQSGRSQFRTELLDQPHTRRIPLAPLTEEQVAGLLGVHLDDQAAAERLAPEFHACSGGNLLLLRALLDDHTLSGGVRKEGYGRAVLRQLGRLDAQVVAVARAVTVLAGGGHPERLARLAGVDTGTVESALGLLESVGLMDGPVLRHDITRQAVLDDLAPEERDRLRQTAASLMYEQGCPAPDIALHLTELDRPGGDWSVDVLLEAAEQELLVGRTHRAVAALEAALRARTEEEPGRAAIEARLVQVRRLFDPAAAEHHLAVLTAAARAGDLDPAHTIDLVRQLLWQGRPAEAGPLLERLREERPEPHSEVAAQLEDTERWLAWTHPTVARRTHRPAPGDGQRQHLGTAPRPAASWSRPTALLADALVNGRAHEVVGQAHQVLKDRGPSYDLTWPEEPALLALGVLLCTDSPDTPAWCDRLLREGHTPYSPTWMGLLSATRAEAALRLGDLTGAVEHAQQALNHISPNAWGVAIGGPLGSLVLATARMGHYDEAGAYLTRTVPKPMFDTRYGLHYLHARGQYHLATGHHHAALADFLACGDRMRAWGIDVPGVVPWRTGAAEAWLELGNREQASRLAYDQLGRPGANGARARAGALRVLAVAGPATRRPQMLSEALDLYERCGDRYEQIRVLADLGAAYHELGDNRRARTHVRRARHLVALCGAAPLSDGLLSFPDEAEEPVAAPGAPVGDNGLLTDSERRVAALAVGGYTNREIAAKLFITPSTVEQHLTRVYRKLGVRCRKALPVELATSVSEAILTQEA
ncbi:LuxR C-terminal-related transcriptional regulator [Streptomyces sp. NPDC086033]|uniref:LuxR C-terminal-related transcriptional regulator n=1 Tax=Streptomyces sp. NPDC086033 TaxID=3365747 RepID=UPI0037CF8761